MTTPTQLPAQLVAGDTWAWTRELPDYLADTWSSVVYFENAAGKFNVAGVADGTTHTFTIAAGTTAGYDAGKYRWRLLATSAGVRVTVEQGEVEVLPDPASTTNYDYRTSARVVLDNIEAYLRDPSSLNAAGYAINGRSISRYSMTELIALKSQMKAEVQREDAAERINAGLGSPRRLYVRFR